MKATELLKHQHDEVRDLYRKYEQAEDDDEKLALFEDIADTLAAHAAVEERLFYPAIYGDTLGQELREAVEEHLAMKRELADLLTMTPDDDAFDAKMKVLIDMVEHHVDDEEREILPKAESQLGEAGLRRLGAQMERLFEELMNEGPSDDIPLETEQAAALK
jgi:hemerythrin-like domain-containing protein